MSGHKPELYRWERVSKPRVYSRSQKVATEDDIKGWIKKVEDASDRAAAETFGTKYVNTDKFAGRKTALTTIENVHEHDAIHEEAKSLLQQWMEDKVDVKEEEEEEVLGASLDIEGYVSGRRTRADVKKEWDHLLQRNEVHHGINSQDPYSMLDEDTDAVVSNILSNMLEKEVVKDDFLQDLGLDDKRNKDPRTKMQLRHQQVKANREKREKALQTRRQQQQHKKDAELMARQMLKKEEMMKVAKEKQEEKQIQKEMARLRRGMAEERQRHEDEKQRKREEEEAHIRQVEAEYDRQLAAEAEARRNAMATQQQRKHKIMAKLQQIHTKRATDNLKLLHGCFTAWYGLVAERRLQQGKARAMGDWRLLLRCWNAWKYYTRTQTLDRETKQHQLDIQRRHRNETRAVEHHRLGKLRRCFTGWALYVEQCKHEKELNHMHVNTKNKMAAFLEAATQGKLWNNTDSTAQQGATLHHSQSMEDVQGSTDSARKHVDEMFSAPVQKRRGSESARSDQSAATTDRSKRSEKGTNKGIPKPMQAWQVSRKHAYLSNSQIASLGQGDDMTQSPPDDTTETPPTKNKKPWEKAPFLPNQFENRQKSQQKMLEMQHKQIKDQQRMIEELTYLQKQQLLQQQVTTEQLRTQILNVNNQQSIVSSTGVKIQPTDKINQHIKQLQKDLVSQVEEERGDNPTSTQAGEWTARTDTTSGPSVMGSARSERSDSSSKVSLPDSSRHAKFLLSMNERAAERNRIKKEREERKRKEEEENLKRLEALAEERRQQDEEEKRKRIEAHREKKRLEKQKELEKQREMDRLRQQYATAAEHQRLALLKFRGWRPWCRLVEMARAKQTKAELHYRNVLKRKVLLNWHGCVDAELRQKEAMADHLHRDILLHRCFNNWKKANEVTAILEQKADRHYEALISVKIFRAWSELTEDEKIAMWHKDRQAKEHNVWRIQKRAFYALKNFKKIIADERKKEERKAELRRKVASLLPDFESAPVRASTDSDVLQDYFK